MVNTAATISATNSTVEGVGQVGTVMLTSTSALEPGLKSTGWVADGELSAGSVTFSDTGSTLSIGLGFTVSGTDSTELATSGVVSLDHTPITLALGSYINSAPLNTIFVILNGGVTGSDTASTWTTTEWT